MKKLISLSLLFLLTINPIMLSAETNDDSVTDFYNQDQGELNEEEQSDQLNEEESVNHQALDIDDESPSLFVLIIQIIAILALIIGLIYVLLKFFNRSNDFNKQGDVLVNLGGVSLGTSKSVQMLKVGDKIFLVGVGDDVSILTEITDESVKKQLIERQQSSTISAQSLLDQFNFKRKEGKTDSPADDESEAFEKRNFAALFKGELDTMKEKRAKIRVKGKEDDDL